MLLLGFLSLGLICWLLLRQLRPVADESNGTRLKGVCPGCRHPVESGWLVCPDCLSRLRHSCQDCGEIHDSWFAFCPWCGNAARGVNSA